VWPTGGNAVISCVGLWVLSFFSFIQIHTEGLTGLWNYTIFITRALCLRYIIQLHNSLSQFTCPSYNFFFHRLACLLNKSYSWLKMEWSRTEKQSKERELDYFLWTTETDRTAVLYCTRNEFTKHEKWSAFYSRGASSQNQKRYVPTLAAMTTYL
jgi:hypothetical protein